MHQYLSISGFTEVGMDVNMTYVVVEPGTAEEVSHLIDAVQWEDRKVHITLCPLDLEGEREIPCTLQQIEFDGDESHKINVQGYQRVIGTATIDDVNYTVNVHIPKFPGEPATVTLSYKPE